MRNKKICPKCHEPMALHTFDRPVWNCVECGVIFPTYVDPPSRYSSRTIPHYFELSSPCYQENWPKALQKLTTPYVISKIATDQATRLISMIKSIIDQEPRGQYDWRSVSDILEQLNNMIHQLPSESGYFVKLGSRSPKDGRIYGKFVEDIGLGESPPRDSLKVTNGLEALTLFLYSYDRTYDDLMLMIENNYEPHIVLRKWIEIPEWSEFRLFIKNRQLVGISQASHHYEAHKEILDHAGSIEWAINRYFRETLRSALPFDDVVADIWVQADEFTPESRETGPSIFRWTVHFIEINPFDIHTDACLFDQNDFINGFDGSFRYTKEKKSMNNDDISKRIDDLLGKVGGL